MFMMPECNRSIAGVLKNVLDNVRGHVLKARGRESRRE
jgi:NAD(P)H-dependent FMN reductase